MVSNRHISKIILVIVAIAALLCMAAVAYSEELTDLLGGKGVRMEYETELFGTDQVMEVDIRMDEETWNKMLSNAMSEEYYVCDVTINGLTVPNVAIRPKGNTSLSAIAMDPDSERYSLKLEFDHFVKGQTCYGLDKLILNNNYADATNMKEAVIYDMFQYIGADASLYNYAKVSVNGEYFGVYLALEGVEESFMLRNFGTQDGELYKPDTMEMGSTSRGGGANLNYTDDELDSYSTIWDSAITGTDQSDHRRVVTALRNVSEGTDLEQYLDIDNVLRYMAVHTFAVNMDSLSGSMSHNYYLYEYDGKLNILPWDYNLSLGGMSMGGSGNATDMVNDAVDTPFSGTKFFNALLENEEYLAKYHEYLRKLVEEYVDGGRFDEVYNRIRSRIDELVANDPTAFYDADEYQTAAQILYETVKLRAESISGQLDGTIPSTDAGQKQDKSALVDASHINVKLMGQFSMGGGNFGGQSSKGSGEKDSSDKDAEGDGTMPQTAQDESGSKGRKSGGDSGRSGGSKPDGFTPGDGGSFDTGNLPDGFDPSSMFGGDGNFDPDSLPDGFDTGNLPDGFDPSSMFGGGGKQGGSFSPSKSGSDSDSGKSRSGSFSGAPGQSSGLSTRAKNLITYGGCLAVLLAAMIIIGISKRRHYRKT